MSTEAVRTYVVGLPVVLTVHPDGTVSAEVDLCEASDLFDGQPTDDKGVPLYTEDEVTEDSITVENAVVQARVTVKA